MVISALEEVGDYAARRGIFLGLENHDSIRNADTLLPMVQAVKNPWVGINLDTGNFHTSDPYRDFPPWSDCHEGLPTDRKPASPA